MKKLVLILAALMLSVSVMVSCENENTGDDTPVNTCEHPAESVVNLREVKATCTTDGLTAGQVCGLCNATVSGRVVIPAFGDHRLYKVPGKEATCLESGATDGWKCSSCGETVTAQQKVEKLPHTVVNSDDVPASCTETGSTGGTHCSVCNTAITSATITPIEPDAHTYEWELTTAPQIGVAGEETGTCHCGATTTRVVDALVDPEAGTENTTPEAGTGTETTDPEAGTEE